MLIRMLNARRAAIGAAAALTMGLIGAGAAQAQAAAPASVDAAQLAKGKRLFMMCASCHDFKPGGPARVGPHLAGIVGREAGTVEGYRYSAALQAKPFVWDEAKLDAWLLKPTAVVPATTMVYMGMAKADDRKALLAYLRSLK